MSRPSESKSPPCYSDSQRMHFYACLPDTRRGSLSTGDAECLRIADDRSESWVRLEALCR